MLGENNHERCMLNNQTDNFPNRIVCLTEETVETLYLLGEQDRIVGVSGFAVRPPQVRKEKPIVSTFTDADVETIMALQPDLVIGFSDIQANIAKTLIERGVTVWVNNYRSVNGILSMISQLGGMIGKADAAQQLVERLKSNIDSFASIAKTRDKKPKVYFEEWFDPLISGIRWVSELVELAGGIDIYTEKRHASLARDRIIADKNDVVNRNPDIILASWCGKMFKKEKLVARENWGNITAVKNDFVFEIKSSIILQPGPAALTDGIQAIADVINKWHVLNG
jgi:iron complex transport system substrate-binding protein